MWEKGGIGRAFWLEQALGPPMSALKARMKTELRMYVSEPSHRRSLLHDFIRYCATS
jgi:hypothetical protein